MGVLPNSIFIEDLYAVSWFRKVNNLVVDVLLGTSFIDRCINGIFHSERNICPLDFESRGNSGDAKDK